MRNMNASKRAHELRTAIVERLEAFNELHMIPEYWRMNGDQVERGVEGLRGMITWLPMEFLSPYLCNVRRNERERLEQGIPF